MKVTRSGEVYAADITYIPMAKGFLYLAAVIDGRSRKVLAHWLSNTPDAALHLKTLEKLSSFFRTISHRQAKTLLIYKECWLS